MNVLAQCFWVAFQVAVYVIGGIGIAELVMLTGYEPTYTSAPKFYLICFAVAAVLFLAPAMIAANAIIDAWERSQSRRVVTLSGKLLQHSIAALSRDGVKRLLANVRRERL
jgi:hypothetical protein